MARSDSDVDESTDEQATNRLLERDEFAAALNARGYTDVLVLRRETGREVLTDRRRAILRYLDRYGEGIESVSDLARRLDRDKGAVSRDLHRLAELDVIEYEGGGDGEPKRPVLKHDHVVIEPVVY
jgi:DNA-binding MarR family transcriptional regulator